jgi:ankyrin repeat protein
MVRWLLEKGVDPNFEDSPGRTALSLAAQHGHIAVVQLLLEKGAELESNDKWAWTLLRYAAESGHRGGGQATLESKDKDGQTPRSWAAENGNETAIRILLNNGARSICTTSS